jgi:hypothetical protein
LNFGKKSYEKYLFLIENQSVCQKEYPDMKIRINYTDSTYIYISPGTCRQEDFDLQKDTYDSYAKRHHWGRKLLAKVFQGEKIQ